jgi:acetaldehyde dehydrogenase (acetylating)
VQFDKDLQSIQEVRNLLRAAKEAAFAMTDFNQKQTDTIVKAMADAAERNAEKLARMAAEETGFGRYEDKIIKNKFASRHIYNGIKDLKTVGIINENKQRKTFDVAVPLGVVAGIIPSTNPTSTAIYKVLIAVKARNAIVLSPHPSAQKAIAETSRIMAAAAKHAGAPDNLISVMQSPTLEGTRELFRHNDTALILATGGSPMVKAAYESGTPAIGVGPGNVPAFIEKSADIRQAVYDIVAGKAFDYGVICASEQSVLVEKPIVERVKKEFEHNDAYFCSPDEKKALEKVMVGKNNHVNGAVVGKSPLYIAKLAGIKVPKKTSILVVPMQDIGKSDPLSFEKLSPVLCFYEVDNWQQGCEKAIAILNYGGIGHTMSLHSKNEDIIREFALYKPAFRIVVNSPATHGAIGYSTNLPPALTLGPGAIGGSSSSDNIGPMHLLNLKHVAYGVRKVENNWLKHRDYEPTARHDAPTESRDELLAKIEQQVVAQLQQTPAPKSEVPSLEEEINIDDIIRKVRKDI